MATCEWMSFMCEEKINQDGNVLIVLLIESQPIFYD